MRSQDHVCIYSPAQAAFVVEDPAELYCELANLVGLDVALYLEI